MGLLTKESLDRLLEPLAMLSPTRPRSKP
jgi:hypothetical protein